MGTRGRPSSIIPPQPQQFTREYIDSDEIKTIWTYDLKINKNGPISVDIIYPKDYFKKSKNLKQRT